MRQALKLSVTAAFLRLGDRKLSRRFVLPGLALVTLLTLFFGLGRVQLETEGLRLYVPRSCESFKQLEREIEVFGDQNVSSLFSSLSPSPPCPP